MVKQTFRIIEKYKMKNFFEKGGLGYMKCAMTDDFNKTVYDAIEKSMFENKLNKVCNIIKKLNISNDVPKFCKTTFSVDKANEIEKSLNDVNVTREKLLIKKWSLEICKDKAISDFDLSNAVKYVSELDDLNKLILEVEKKCKVVDDEVKNSELDYQNQILSIKENYDNIDIMECVPAFGDEYSETVVNDYKIERAKACVNNFLSDLPTSQAELAKNNEIIKRYVINVGENI